MHGWKGQYHQCLDRTTVSLEEDPLLRKTRKVVCGEARVALTDGN